MNKANILCYVCYNEKGSEDLNLFSTKSTHSNTLIYKFIEVFLGLEDDRLLNEPGLYKEKCFACKKCFEKVKSLLVLQKEINGIVVDC